MIEHGRVRAVTEVYDGSTLTANASVGATTLLVESTQDFDEVGGSLRTAAGTILVYTGLNDDTGELFLAVPLAVAVTADDPVLVYPLTGYRLAYVHVDGIGDEGDALIARVSHALWERLTVGTRTDDEAEWVRVVNDGDGWRVTDILGSPPVSDLPYISDGKPPASSPTPTVEGTDRALLVRWSPVANTDPITYDVHVSASTPFTPSASTLFASVSEGTSVLVTHLGAGGARLVNATVYRVRIVARDADGSAAASAEVAGTPLSRTDQQPPGTATAPTVQGGIGVLVVRWASIANADPLFYEVHVSTSSPFTPSDSTLAGKMFGEFFVIRALPNGTPLQFTTPTPTVYYVRLVAFDEDVTDIATQRNTRASPVGSGSLSQAGSSDLAVGSVTAAKLESTLILTSRLVAGPDASGARIELGYLNTAAPTHGIRVYRNATDLTFSLDGNTGNVVFHRAATLRLLANGGELDVNAQAYGTPLGNEVRLSSLGIEMFASGTRKVFLAANGGSAVFSGSITASSIDALTTIIGAEFRTRDTGENVRMGTGGDRIEFRNGTTRHGFIRYDSAASRFVIAADTNVYLDVRSADDFTRMRLFNGEMTFTVSPAQGPLPPAPQITISPTRVTLGIGLTTLNVEPDTDNSRSLGLQTKRYARAWLASTDHTSDVRAKRDIARTDLGLGFVRRLRPVRFRWNLPEAPDLDGTLSYGLIAQEVDHDGIVTRHPEAHWSLNYNALIAPLIAAIQELDAEVRAMRAHRP